MNRYLRKAINILLSLLLGTAILYWMYRDFDFKMVEDVMLHKMNWWWMIASFPFCVLAQMFRGWRWKQTLEPLNERPRTSSCINAIFISYAASLVIPRIGEFTRCGVLTKKDGTSFSKALGTVVTERAVDSLLMLLFSLIVFLMQIPVFMTFFSKTGTRLDGVMDFLGSFSTTGWIVTFICGIAAVTSLWLVRKRLAFYDKVKGTVMGIYDGVMSLRGVKNVPLFLFYSVMIWVMYFLHYYITFYCFDGTASLGITCGLVTFIVGSIAVLVPTPNGAGSWHFAVKTMLILYGVADNEALFFVLIVHAIQTLMVALLGLYGWMRVSLTK